MADKAEPAEPGETGPRYWLTWVLALLLVALFVLTCWLLYRIADDIHVNEALWARYVFIFGALEAIAFTAVGWLFGREVHRATADSARKDAKEAKQEGKAAAAEAKKGFALAQAVKSSVSALGGVDGIGGASAATESTPSQLISLKQMADRLFPEE